MKQSRYFTFVLQRRPEIRLDWVIATIQRPQKTQLQTDGRIRYWARIAEYENRALRVIMEPDGETVLNAFFDRTFKDN